MSEEERKKIIERYSGEGRRQLIGKCYGGTSPCGASPIFVKVIGLAKDLNKLVVESNVSGSSAKNTDECSLVDLLYEFGILK